MKLLVCLFSLVTFIGSARAEIPLFDDIASLNIKGSMLLKTKITHALESPTLDEITMVDHPSVKAFYEAREHEAAWVESGFLRERKAEGIVTVLEDSWRHGLNPDDYHVAYLRDLMETAKGADQYKLDLLLSDALVRYGRDLTGMRVNPKSIGQRSKYWRQPLRGIDVLDYVSNAEDPKSALKKLAPQGKLYKTLQKELLRLYNTNKKPDINPVRINGLLKPGQVRNSVRDVRARMGFKAEDAPQGVNTYDDDLAQAVMAFQKAHGLKPDGIIGPHTVKLMNITRQDKIDQILVNLERLRWVEPDKPDRYVMVNVPSATLWAVEDNEVKLEMPVVVGREKRPTKIFSTMITGIRLNPTWTVPPTIKKDDYLPKLREDPYYLSDRGIELMDGDMTIDPGMIDWEEATWADVNQMRMVQGSGQRNPLGLYRVLMNNPYNIYLHDTPSKSLFRLDNRALSSGCVRMQDAEAFTNFVLSRNQNWSKERKGRLLERGKQIDIRADDPLPVYILYQTIWLGDRGQLVYGHDIYGQDKTLLNVLKKEDAIIEPVESEIKTASKS
jgi:murein L,D-transpeptidase YcbB/YkuD